jgi:hypothetical protein
LFILTACLFAANNKKIMVKRENKERVKILRMRDSYTNPYETIRIEYFEIFGLTNRIHDTNLLKIGIRNESTIRILWNQVYETNPRYESFEYRMDSRIRSTGFVWICTCSKYVYVLRFVRIREDSLDSWKQVESFENWLDSYVRYDTNLSMSGFVNHDTIRIRDSYRKVRIEPFWSQDSYSRYGTNPWIRETNPCFYESLIRIPHPYFWPTKLNFAFRPTNERTTFIIKVKYQRQPRNKMPNVISSNSKL